MMVGRSLHPDLKLSGARLGRVAGGRTIITTTTLGCSLVVRIIVAPGTDGPHPSRIRGRPMIICNMAANMAMMLVLWTVRPPGFPTKPKSSTGKRGLPELSTFLALQRLLTRSTRTLTATPMKSCWKMVAAPQLLPYGAKYRAG